MNAMCNPPAVAATDAGLFKVQEETADGDVVLGSYCCLHSARAAVDLLIRYRAGDWEIIGPDAAGVMGSRGGALSSGPRGGGPNMDTLSFW
jgi:hypothetical protein